MSQQSIKCINLNNATAAKYHYIFKVNNDIYCLEDNELINIDPKKDSTGKDTYSISFGDEKGFLDENNYDKALRTSDSTFEVTKQGNFFILNPIKREDLYAQRKAVDPILFEAKKEDLINEIFVRQAEPHHRDTQIDYKRKGLYSSGIYLYKSNDTENDYEFFTLNPNEINESRIEDLDNVLKYNAKFSQLFPDFKNKWNVFILKDDFNFENDKMYTLQKPKSGGIISGTLGLLGLTQKETESPVLKLYPFQSPFGIKALYACLIRGPEPVFILDSSLRKLLLIIQGKSKMLKVNDVDKPIKEIKINVGAFQINVKGKKMEILLNGKKTDVYSNVNDILEILDNPLIYEIKFQVILDEEVTEDIILDTVFYINEPMLINSEKTLRLIYKGYSTRDRESVQRPNSGARSPRMKGKLGIVNGIYKLK